jgi:hypothetical protein
VFSLIELRINHVNRTSIGNMMKMIFRKTIAFLLIAPAAMWTHLISLFIGKEKAANFCGPYFTLATKPFAWFLAPHINHAADFDHVFSGMQKKFWLWKLFFDFSIGKNTTDILQLNITYCPIQDMLKNLYFPELTLFVCDADWKIANENEDKWLFKREHQLATGDSYCDHTYLRK